MHLEGGRVGSKAEAVADSTAREDASFTEACSSATGGSGGGEGGGGNEGGGGGNGGRAGGGGEEYTYTAPEKLQPLSVAAVVLTPVVQLASAKDQTASTSSESATLPPK